MKTSGVVLSPPRPNLGPEGFEEEANGAFWLLAAPLIVLGAVFAVHVMVRRAKRGGKSLEKDAYERQAEPTTTSAELAALVHVVRNSLVPRFGEGIRAKTTEELANNPLIAEFFGPEGSSRLTEFLRAADVVRFAVPGRDDPQRVLDAWSDWAEGFLSAAGVRSTINGK